MSDVPARCPQCGRQLMVSEFVDAESLVCPACGSKMTLDKSGLAPKSATPLLRKPQQDPAAPAADPGRKMRTVRRRRKKWLVRVGRLQLSEYYLSWMLFFLLGGVFYYLRWGGGLTGADLEDGKLYGMIGLALFMAVVIVEAFTLEMFDGLLSFFVPPYAFYYLFFKSDSFFLRAIVAAFAVGFGYDLGLVVLDGLVTLYKEITMWIGGGWEK